MAEKAVGPALGARAARGGAVALGGQAVRIGVQVLSVVVLSRLLTPSDYGLLAMVMAVIGVADVFRDLGLSTAAVQARTLSEGQRSNLFWVNTGLGLFLGLAAFVAAPLMDTIYGEPELVQITRVMALVFVINGIATQYRADLTRRLLFLRLAVADVVAPVVALGAAVAMALAGAGYWSLVGQQVVQYVVMTVVVMSAGRWAPHRPDRRTPMGGLLRFGWHMVGVELIGYAGKNADALVIGTRFGSEALGLYNRAFQLLMMPLVQVRTPTTQIALPVLASLQDDPARYGAYLRRGQLALGYTLVVSLGLVVGAADPITDLFLGAQWQDVAPLLRLLALASVFQTLAFVGYWVYLSRGLTAALVRYSLFETAVRLTCLVVGSNWGVVGVAAGFAVAPALTWPVSLWWLSRLAPIPVRSLLGAALRILLVTLAVAAGSWGAADAVPGLPAALQLLIAGVGGVAALLGLMLCAPVLRRDLRDVREVVQLALLRRRRTAPAAG
jgi:O-antigen/teichoic acid export membrane protein